MTGIVMSVMPVFLLIILGQALRRGVIPNADFWNLNDRLVYWVLFPCLLFNRTSTLGLDLARAGPFSAALVGGFTIAALFAVVLGKRSRLENPSVSSILQGGARHNTFIALAVAERVYGIEGLAIAIIATSVLIPVTNVTLVTAMVSLHGDTRGGRFVLPVLRDLGRNPLLISVISGVLWNSMGFGELSVLHELTSILGAAALPIVLLGVGANIRSQALRIAGLPLAISVIAKMVVFPVAVLVLAHAFGLSALETRVALVFGAVPTAASAFTLARQMGGDAPLMAAIIALQTGLSFVTLPLALSLAERWVV